MKITIDTKEDSSHEIKKAIKLLLSLVGSSEIYSNESELTQESKNKNIFDDNEPAPNLMGMFDSAQEPKDPDEPENPDEPEEDSDAPALEFY